MNELVPVEWSPASDNHLKGRFAIIRLWPDKAVAEHENLERFRAAAKKIGVEMLEVDRHGYFLTGVRRQVTDADVDFVAHLHYETPKAYDAFSYGFLWNPIEFYHEWGYDHYVRNQLSHDHFVSAGGVLVDDIVVRVRPEEFGRDSFPVVNHTLCDPVVEPQLRTDRRAFYCGINWELITGKPGRHSDVLKLLDQRNLIDIYGPRQLDNVRPWDGYKTYRGSLPFDGRSLIYAAAKAGIVLVFSSDAHKNSGIMSNRLFECLAAGAIIIGDNHPFLQEHFSDCALFVDHKKNSEERAEEVLKLIAWTNNNPEEAHDMAVRAQQRFLDRFSLDTQLSNLFRHRASILQAAHEHRQKRKADGIVTLALLPLDTHEPFLENFARNLTRQTSHAWQLIVAVEKPEEIPAVRELFNRAAPQGRVDVVALGDSINLSLTEVGRAVGELSGEMIGDYLCVLNGTEKLHGTFVETIQTEMERTPDRDIVAFNHLILHGAEGERHIDLQDTGFHPIRNCAISSIVLKMATYQKLRPYLDYLSAERWIALLSACAYQGASRHVPPVLKARLTEWEGYVRRMTAGTARLSAQQQDQILAEFYTLRSDSAASSSAMHHHPAQIRLAVEPLLNHALSVPGIKALDKERRRQITAILLGSLPWPSWMLSIFRSSYMRFDKREKLAIHRSEKRDRNKAGKPSSGRDQPG